MGVVCVSISTYQWVRKSNLGVVFVFIRICQLTKERVVCKNYIQCSVPQKFHFGIEGYQLGKLLILESQFFSRTHFFQSLKLTLAGPVCSALHQNWIKFWLALPIVAWGPAFIQLKCKFLESHFLETILQKNSRIEQFQNFSILEFFNSRITCSTAGQQPIIHQV